MRLAAASAGPGSRKKRWSRPPRIATNTTSSIDSAVAVTLAQVLPMDRRLRARVAVAIFFVVLAIAGVRCGSRDVCASTAAGGLLAALIESRATKTMCRRPISQSHAYQRQTCHCAENDRPSHCRNPLSHSVRRPRHLDWAASQTTVDRLPGHRRQPKVHRGQHDGPTRS